MNSFLSCWQTSMSRLRRGVDQMIDQGSWSMTKASAFWSGAQDWERVTSRTAISETGVQAETEL